MTPAGRPHPGRLPDRVMGILNTLHRIADALITALGVVVGLVPDPTQTQKPVPVEVKHTTHR